VSGSVSVLLGFRTGYGFVISRSSVRVRLPAPVFPNNSADFAGWLIPARNPGYHRATTRQENPAVRASLDEGGAVRRDNEWAPPWHGGAACMGDYLLPSARRDMGLLNEERRAYRFAGVARVDACVPSGRAACDTEYSRWRGEEATDGGGSPLRCRRRPHPRPMRPSQRGRPAAVPAARGIPGHRNSRRREARERSRTECCWSLLLLHPAHRRLQGLCGGSVRGQQNHQDESDYVATPL